MSFIKCLVDYLASFDSKKENIKGDKGEQIEAAEKISRLEGKRRHGRFLAAGPIKDHANP